MAENVARQRPWNCPRAFLPNRFGFRIFCVFDLTIFFVLWKLYFSRLLLPFLREGAYIGNTVYKSRYLESVSRYPRFCFSASRNLVFFGNSQGGRIAIFRRNRFTRPNNHWSGCWTAAIFIYSSTLAIASFFKLIRSIQINMNDRIPDSIS